MATDESTNKMKDESKRTVKIDEITEIAEKSRAGNLSEIEKEFIAEKTPKKNKELDEEER